MLTLEITIFAKNDGEKWSRSNYFEILELLLPSAKTQEYLRNWDKLSVYFSIFEWWNWPKHQFCQIANGFFFGIAVNFSLQILRSKHLVCLSFWDTSCDSRAKIHLSMEKMWTSINYCFCVWQLIIYFQLLGPMWKCTLSTGEKRIKRTILHLNIPKDWYLSFKPMHSRKGPSI